MIGTLLRSSLGALLILALAAAAVSLVLPRVAGAQGNSVWPDLNGNGIIEIGELFDVIDYYFSGEQIPAPDPSSTMWEDTGRWYRNTGHETALNAHLQSQGLDVQAKIATLDSIPTILPSDLSLSLGCIDDIQVAYLPPYSGAVPPSVSMLG